ncbi:Ppx/GppA phosphatase family protein [Roseivirga pacifica]|uniref:Ppx/GppA phosphatase family protein n=1 Tax=Roseivirga pacifica TaxID=1267423 RepID=UPI00209639C8|nr:exopolyphosphatase [Roseivirga pacifica]MCO6360128.1 exopolyphosphatase [Roseivirga pacifica]MCO6367499.1 exopolyphosphatase [Roseivirga pacifica]MCO6369970.1 exopolyphosphatase [Roseivirga pacifica]MCO6375155.1 exopolyphosphatase [Roseivirga pacifica]MCO6380414.1 exopolyphosphatase [Roseivirga pacifica]
MRRAVIDLGTNTFHLFIVEINDKSLTSLYREKIAVKIGQNGISKGRIAKDAIKRALHTLKVFKTVIDQFGVTEVCGVATSAIRNAKNGQELINEIKSTTGISIDIISGDREAELIFKGVRAAMDMRNTNHLAMDIGGGSVEFIIGNQQEILWKQSFEIGAQRLLDKFHKHDPMPKESVDDMFTFFKTELSELLEAITKHQPEAIVGCSGTFDTLCEIYRKELEIEEKGNGTTYNLPIKNYRDIHRELLIKNKAQRLEIPGMVSMRVDMIVVASCLISFVTEYLPVDEIIASSYALKEGLLYEKERKPIAQELS